jgi:hypothetical protein
MKPFTRVAVIVLWLIALLQLVRFIAGRQITLNGAPVPLWPSGVVAAPIGRPAIMVWREPPAMRAEVPAPAGCGAAALGTP